MPKHAFLFLFPLESCLLTWRSIMHADSKEGWKPCADGPRMHDGRFSTGKSQSFYFPDDHLSMPSWFKGMAIIIAERGLWPADGLPAQCPSFCCPPGRTDCCCHQLLFSQPDFTGQKPQLQEAIKRRSHLCDFYPKYHCEMNFIEQYWGSAKLQFQAMGRAMTMEEIEVKVVECLDDVPLLHIQRFILSFFLSIFL